VHRFRVGVPGSDLRRNTDDSSAVRSGEHLESADIVAVFVSFERLVADVNEAFQDWEAAAEGRLKIIDHLLNF
jgi:hypothetical protein